MSSRIIALLACVALFIASACNSGIDAVPTTTPGTPAASTDGPAATPIPTSTPSAGAITKFEEGTKFIQLTSIDQEIPNYQKNICAGTNDIDPHLVQLDSEKISCLIRAGKTNAPLLLVGGEALESEVLEAISEAVNYGEEIFGKWGPVVAIAVQYQDPSVEYLATQSCRIRAKYTPYRPFKDCFDETLTFFSGFDECCGAVHDPPVPLNPVRIQYFTYSAPDTMLKENQLRKVTLHEYIHVVQNAQIVHPHEIRCSDEENKLCELGFGPVWLEEGSAEYFAQYYSDKRGWADFENTMKQNLESALNVKQRGYSLRDVATRKGQREVAESCRCGGQLYYDTGTWAAAWLVNRSGEDAFFVEHFPNAAHLGYEKAFKNAFGLTLDEFYSEFDAFLDKPKSEQLKILKLN